MNVGETGVGGYRFAVVGWKDHCYGSDFNECDSRKEHLNKGMDGEENGGCSSPRLCDEQGESLSDMEGFISELEIYFDESLDIGMEELEHYPKPGNEQQRRATEEAQRVTVTEDDVLMMEFNNPEEAMRFYQQYSRRRGFAMRQGKKLKNKSGEVVRHTYLYNREGLEKRSG
ncbi:hypothetical protein PIB30_061734 [Stylosanthes scabra]|uniref:FAR1 domain-containing protein n=1 Tax=Stylosanthes scabra TaxID=79078 RepID=A0ABU6ZJP8_9FABA|nr:hypothetical protein [Stylosanthes scabra]